MASTETPPHGRSHRVRLQYFAMLALKNLFRYRRRTVVTASAVAFGVAIFVAMASLLNGLAAEGDRNLANYETSSAAITGAGYWRQREEYPLDILVENTGQILSVLDADGVAAAPRVAFRGELIVHYDPYPEDGSVYLALYGIDVERDPQVFRLAETVNEGRLPEPGEDGILISAWLAERLGAELSYPVTITTRTRDGFHQILDMDIVGIYQTPNPTVDRSQIYLPLDVVDTYLEMQGAVTAIHLALPEPVPGAADLGPVKEALERDREGVGGTGIELLSFAEMTEEFAAAVEIQDVAFNIVLVLLGFIAVVGISNTMLMAVLEREREIGMMRAIGMRDGEIRLMFALEAAAIGLLGAAAGLLLGARLVWYLVNHGIDYGTLLEGVEMDFRFADVLYGVWSVRTMFTAAVGAAMLAAVVALLPVRAILRREITESLRRH